MDNEVAGPAEGGLNSPREQLLEVLVFLFLIVPSMFLSFFALQPGATVSFAFLAVSTVLRDLGLVCLVLFFLWRNGEPFRAIGWTWRNLGKEIMLGAALFVPLFAGALWLEAILVSLGLTLPGTPEALQIHGGLQTAGALILVAVVAVAEETIFRGYLILRFRAIIRNPAAAVLLSASLFSLGHGYEGSAGVVAVAYLGVAFGAVYYWRGSLVAPVVMHFLQDFIGVIIAPLLGLK